MSRSVPSVASATSVTWVKSMAMSLRSRNNYGYDGTNRTTCTISDLVQVTAQPHDVALP